MEKIPIEIGTQIASLAGRPILYKQLWLRYGSSTIRDTLKMLNKNERVKQSVAALYLFANVMQPTDEMTKDWITASDLQGMGNIRFLSIRSFCYFSPYLIREMVRNVYSAAPNLESVEFDGGHGAGELDEDTSFENLVPRTLNSFYVNLSNEIPQLLTSTFLGNASSVSTLNLFSTDEEQHILGLLPTLTLPKLENFSLTMFFGINDAIDPLLAFLVAHPLIKVLSVDSSKGLGDLTGLHLNEGFLQNITSLSANLAIIDGLSRIGAPLAKLTTLEIDNRMMDHFDHQWYDEELIYDRHASTFTELAQRVGGFRQLRFFTIFEMGPSFIVPFLQKLGDFTPSLEHLSFLKQSDLGEHGLSDKIMLRFVDALNSFQNLARIDLRRGVVHQSRTLAFAQSLKTIRRIHVFPYRGYNEESIVEVDSAQPLELKVLRPPPEDTVWWMNNSLVQK